ncbi:glycosyltransferase family 25 protein [Ectothiorhodospira haloalkaliphila]|uniref:glycosyltransferase family 25 protein n=1 Tax=Ectothiorhodospira haloalkaliphila TaxID=421628 RepID=UPI001EE8B2C3|nr:glycosyltransferase family 25 protein [Ectothiorhodospira haloalkaliphila]MCG5526262.1 glycosyltransferase family 25 protein [Ectothiorhodospira haloalkaliphila]
MWQGVIEVDKKNSHLEIVVISLPNDCKRREHLRQQFPRYFQTFHIIDGIDLRAPDSGINVTLPTQCSRLARKPLTREEIGCAMSHLKALEYAASSKACSVLILEDDVLGTDESIDAIDAVIQELPKHHFLLCGGQEGLRGERYLYGRKKGDNHYLLPGVVLRFVARACAYAVTPSMAVVIQKRQRQCLDRADHWRMLLLSERAIFFTQKLKHPSTPNESHLEKGRSILKQENPWRRARADGLRYTLMTQAIKIVLPIIARALGWTRPQK